ncbi:hypothetical protein Q7P35_001599 [Cladosporium inversicolor]
MADYEPVGPPETAAHKTKKSHTNHPSRPHTPKHAVGRHNKKKRNRDSGVKTMNQLANALARISLRDDDSKHKNGGNNRPHAHHNKKKRNHDSGATTMKQLIRALAQSNLRDDDDSQHGNGKKLTKSQRKKQKIRPPRRGAQAQRPSSLGETQSGGQSGQSTTSNTRRRKDMLPLPSDNVYLSKVRGFRAFMSNDQTRDWIKSVFKPQIENWHHELLSVPQNQSRVKAAQAAPYVFSNAVVEEAIDQHSSSGLLGSLLGEKNSCPTDFHLEKKRNDSLTFIQHSAMIACLVVRDGQLSHQFSSKALDRKRHQAAATLLASVIMDLKTDFGYFVRLLLDVEEKNVSTSEDGQTLAAMGASEEEEQGVEVQASIKKAPRVLRMSSGLFGSIGRALLGLQHNSDCEISLRRSETFGGEYRIVLDGTIDQVREAQQVIQTLADSSPVSAEQDLFSVPNEAMSD